jgi:hypothetical protein
VKRIEEIRRIGRPAVGKRRVEFLIFVNVASAQGEPPVAALILILRIKARIRVFSRLRKRPHRSHGEELWAADGLAGMVRLRPPKV